VAHESFLKLTHEELMSKIVKRGVLCLVKPVIDPARFQREGVRVWRL